MSTLETFEKMYLSASLKVRSKSFGLLIFFLCILPSSRRFIFSVLMVTEAMGGSVSLSFNSVTPRYNEIIGVSSL